MDIEKHYMSTVNDLYINPFYKQVLTSPKALENDGRFYLNYPVFFADYFGKIPSEKLNALCVAAFLYYQGALYSDQIVDKKDVKLLPLMNVCQEEAVRLLSSIFEHKNIFWKYWNKRKDEYFKAIEDENKFYNEVFSYSKYYDIADKKSALGKIAIDVFYALNKNQNSEQTYEALLKSHYYFSIGMQIYDDIHDFKEDYNNNQFNIAYYELTNFFKQKNIDYSSTSIEELNKDLYIEEVAQKLFKKAIGFFNKAKTIAKESHGNTEWVKGISKTRKAILGYLDSTEGYLKVLKKRIELESESKNKIINPKVTIGYSKENSISKGLEFILNDRSNGFFKLKHIMYLSRLENFSSKSSVHIGDVFQRALLCDALIDVNQLNKIDIQKLIDEEVQYLMSQRLNDNVGAWNYFPSVKEIAADADDLGQMMQVLFRNGNTELIDKYCSTGIKILFHERYHDDGGIETWIIPKKKRTAIQKKQEKMNNTYWGVGPDIEVMSNFLYAMVLYDKSEYQSAIDKSLGYIIAQQDDAGYFESRWYYGNYYGTYVTVRLLNELKDDSEAILPILLKSVDYILCNQNKDGGWGLEGEDSDATNTALSALTLMLVESYIHFDISKLELGIEYLKKTQGLNGGWSATNFIKPRLNDPYLSDVLTTAYALKALSIYESTRV